MHWFLSGNRLSGSPLPASARAPPSREPFGNRRLLIHLPEPPLDPLGEDVHEKGHPKQGGPNGKKAVEIGGTMFHIALGNADDGAGHGGHSAARVEGEFR